MYWQGGVDLAGADIRCGLYCAYVGRCAARWYRENIPVAEERYEQYTVERKNKERP
ncbi:MAG: hypothetical protein QOH97_4100 [Actinoplanes sp.]|jgi:hypothetical protein|nr:hypothetical protein [Actinoplanes sp.]